jgi:hypothetical protein
VAELVCGALAREGRQHPRCGSARGRPGRGGADDGSCSCRVTTSPRRPRPWRCSTRPASFPVDLA